MIHSITTSKLSEFLLPVFSTTDSNRLGIRFGLGYKLQPALNPVYQQSSEEMCVHAKVTLPCWKQCNAPKEEHAVSISFFFWPEGAEQELVTGFSKEQAWE